MIPQIKPSSEAAKYGWEEGIEISEISPIGVLDLLFDIIFKMRVKTSTEISYFTSPKSFRQLHTYTSDQSPKLVSNCELTSTSGLMVHLRFTFFEPISFLDLLKNIFS